MWNLQQPVRGARVVIQLTNNTALGRKKVTAKMETARKKTITRIRARPRTTTRTRARARTRTRAGA